MITTLRLMTVATLPALLLVLIAQAANATDHGPVDLTGQCADEVTGEPGLLMLTGECITPAEYDIIFSVEALAQVPHPHYPGQSVAEVAGLIGDPTPASERLLGVGLVDQPASFRQLVHIT